MPTVLACVGLLVCGVGIVFCSRAGQADSRMPSVALRLPKGQWTSVGCAVESTVLRCFANRVPNPLAVLRSPILGVYTPQSEARVHPNFLVGLAPMLVSQRLSFLRSGAVGSRSLTPFSGESDEIG